MTQAGPISLAVCTYKLFSKTYFLVYAYVFHGIMKFKFLKFSNLNISRTKITFDIKEKTQFY